MLVGIAFNLSPVKLLPNGTQITSIAYKKVGKCKEFGESNGVICYDVCSIFTWVMGLFTADTDTLYSFLKKLLLMTGDGILPH